jgi:hypothetical protein
MRCVIAINALKREAKSLNSLDPTLEEDYKLTMRRIRWVAKWRRVIDGLELAKKMTRRYYGFLD